jgi:hypothetical protein
MLVMAAHKSSTVARTNRIPNWLQVCAALFAPVHPGDRMSNYELAQLNVATMKEPLDSPAMADFVANLDRINALAESSPGFVWRLQTDEGDATAMRPMGESTLVNISVWKDAESLSKYVYESAHVEIMRRRKEWFERMREAYVVLWWVKQGHRPTAAEAITRLELLRAQGPTHDAFTLGKPFLPPDHPQSGVSSSFGSECPAN